MTTTALTAVDFRERKDHGHLPKMMIVKQQSGEALAASGAARNSQLAKLTEGVATVPHGRRDEFLRAVAARLEHGQVDDSSWAIAVDQALGDLDDVIDAAIAVAS